MSQQKVDQYKKDKANRQKMMKKEKILFRLEMTACAIVALFVIGWIGYSGYRMVERSKDEVVQEYQIDTTAIDDYLTSLSES